MTEEFNVNIKCKKCIAWRKEFIKKRNQLDSDLRNNRITWQKFLDKRRKLAGEKFK